MTTASGSRIAPHSGPGPSSWPDRLGPCATDDQLADALENVLQHIPTILEVDASAPYPLLQAVTTWARSSGAVDPARCLQLIAALIHRSADERRTAEYLLRHRDDILLGTRSSIRLVRSARCAAEMDWRRIQLREVPSEHMDSTWPDPGTQRARTHDASVGDTVLEFLERASGAQTCTGRGRHRFLNAVVMALELSERHASHNGTQPSVVAMRPAARKAARLATHLRDEFGSPKAVRAMARLLLGSDGTPIETSLLWWAAKHPGEPELVPAEIARRWRRDFLASCGETSRVS